jgi:hypothetical protein
LKSNSAGKHKGKQDTHKKEGTKSKGYSSAINKSHKSASKSKGSISAKDPSKKRKAN